LGFTDEVLEASLFMKFLNFVRYAWLVLAYNVIVILWGVFLRASKSGDGCGQHWLTCNGEIIPSAAELKTTIEFSHRITSAIAFFAVLGLLFWAFRKFDKGHPSRKMAFGAFIFIVTEALIGAGLVLTGNTAENLTPTRPLWMAGHLINTLILLAFLSLTAWFASENKKVSFNLSPRDLILIITAFLGILFVSLTGSIAALSNLIFPSSSLIEGFIKDFSETSHLLVRLRISHPIVSIFVSVYLIFFVEWIKKRAENTESLVFWGNKLSLLVVIQILSGAITLLTLSPILMQVLHLLLADLIWISLVLFTANFLAEKKASEACNLISKSTIF
jgi:heme A synthase